MDDRGKTTENIAQQKAAASPQSLEDRLVAEYGDELAADGYSEDQKREFLLALWQLMVGFVDLGFSVKSGDKFAANTAIGFDDVLNYIYLEDTAPETVAPLKITNKKEQP